ncbi:hypothetical protein BKA83DRAFT_4126718 [Pisolithus microcarpus]|nr:hypothetical protein BKA83DRAFT_4126718 [Pisolithus microcarpus]
MANLPYGCYTGRLMCQTLSYSQGTLLNTHLHQTQHIIIAIEQQHLADFDESMWKERKQIHKHKPASLASDVTSWPVIKSYLHRVLSTEVRHGASTKSSAETKPYSFKKAFLYQWCCCPAKLRNNAKQQHDGLTNLEGQQEKAHLHAAWFRPANLTNCGQTSNHERKKAEALAEVNICNDGIVDPILDHCDLDGHMQLISSLLHSSMAGPTPTLPELWLSIDEWRSDWGPEGRWLMRFDKSLRKAHEKGLATKWDSKLFTMRDGMAPALTMTAPGKE